MHWVVLEKLRFRIIGTSKDQMNLYTLKTNLRTDNYQKLYQYTYHITYIYKLK